MLVCKAKYTNKKNLFYFLDQKQTKEEQKANKKQTKKEQNREKQTKEEQKANKKQTKKEQKANKIN